MEMFTAPLNPSIEVTERVHVWLPPAERVGLTGEIAMEKSPVGEGEEDVEEDGVETPPPLPQPTRGRNKTRLHKTPKKERGIPMSLLDAIRVF
jgi:hypothetical protein